MNGLFNGLNAFLVAVNVGYATQSLSWFAASWIFCFVLFNLLTDIKDKE
jgi:hypothetical protein